MEAVAPPQLPPPPSFKAEESCESDSGASTDVEGRGPSGSTDLTPTMAPGADAVECEVIECSSVTGPTFVAVAVHGASLQGRSREPGAVGVEMEKGGLGGLGKGANDWGMTPRSETGSMASTSPGDWGLADDRLFGRDDDFHQHEAVHVGGELSISDIDERYNRLLTHARFLSYIGFCVSLVQGCISVGFGISYNIVSLTAMGAQICIDLLSSVMVVWRFYMRSEGARRNPRHADVDTRLKEALRERRAALGVGCLLAATSVWAASWAFVKVYGAPPAAAEQVVRARVTLSVAWPGFAIFSVVSLFKWNYALKLRSRVLQKDAVCSTFGAALSFVSALFASIDYAVSGQKMNTGAADSVAALIMAALIMVEGLRTIYQNTIGWIPPSGVTRETVEQYYQSKRVVAG